MQLEVEGFDAGVMRTTVAYDTSVGIPSKMFHLHEHRAVFVFEVSVVHFDMVPIRETRKFSLSGFQSLMVILCMKLCSSF